MPVLGTMVTVSVMVVCGGIYGVLKEKKGHRVLVFKAVATGMAVLAAGYELWQDANAVSGMLFLAAVLCLAADVLLELWLPAGVLAFGAAHLAFAAAFGMQCRVRWYTLALFGVCYLLFAAGLFRYLPEAAKMNPDKRIPDFVFRLGACLYPVLLCASSALAVTAAVQNTAGGASGRTGIAGGAGGLLFFVSDYLLAWRKLGGRRELKYRLAVLVCYYFAVYLMVW